MSSNQAGEKKEVCFSVERFIYCGSEVNYRLNLLGFSRKSLVIHHNYLKPYYGKPQQLAPSASIQLPTTPRFSNVPLAGGYLSSFTDSR